MARILIVLVIVGIVLLGCGIVDDTTGTPTVEPGVGGPLATSTLDIELDVTETPEAVLTDTPAVMATETPEVDTTPTSEGLVEEDLVILLPDVDFHVRGSIVDFQFRLSPDMDAEMENDDLLETLGTIIIEPNAFLGIGEEFEEAIVQVTSLTQVWLRSGDGEDDELILGSYEHLAMGRDVTVGFTDPVEVTGLVQGTAGHIVILDEFEFRDVIDPEVPGMEGGVAIGTTPTPEVDPDVLPLILEDDEVAELRPSIVYNLRGDVVDFQFRASTLALTGREIGAGPLTLGIIVVEPDAILGIGVPWERSIVELTDETQVWLHLEDDTVVEGSLSDLRAGVDVAVAFDSPVYQIEPVRGMASEIIIFDLEELQ